MRIGIVSLYRTLKLHQNYGTLLQNFALQAHLRKQGHDTFWIRTEIYRSNKQSQQSIYNLPSNIYKYYMIYTDYFRSMIFKTDHAYTKFFHNYVSHTSREYDYDELVKDVPTADAYITGSDQVWTSGVPLFFLDFAPPAAIRISYAASAKWQKISGAWLEAAAGRLGKFRAVSVREVDGIAICRMLGRDDAQVVLDPVFLLKADEYRALVREEGNTEDHSRKYIWQYMVALPWGPASDRLVRQFAERNDLAMKTDHGPGKPSPGGKSATRSARRTPTAWIDAFDKSEYVVTNSFHGTAFSIIFGKPFLVSLREGETASGNARILSLLNLLGLEGRAVSESELEGLSVDDFSLRLRAPIAWDDVGDRLTLWRDRSIRFLDDALEQGPVGKGVAEEISV